MRDPFQVFKVHDLYAYDNIKPPVPVVVAYRLLGLGFSGGTERGGCTPLSITIALTLFRWVVEVAYSYSDGAAG